MGTMCCVVRVTLISLTVLSGSASGFTARSSQPLAINKPCSTPHSSGTSTSAVLTTPHHRRCHGHTTFALRSHGGSELNPSVGRRNDGKLPPGLSVPALYALTSAGLVYKSLRAITVSDASILMATAALSLFNLSSADRKRFLSASKASTTSFGIGTISTIEEVDAAEQKRYAAQRFITSLVVKTFGQALGMIRMIVDPTPGGGAALFMATQIIYFGIGGGKYRHTDDGQLDPIEERLVVGAGVTYALFTLAALASGRLASGTVEKGIATFVYCFGCLTGAFDGIMSLFFGGRRAGRSKVN